MASLTGNIRNLVGGQLANPMTPIVILAGLSEAGNVAGEVRLGGHAVELASDGTFIVTGIPDGDYRLVIRFYDPPTRSIVTIATVFFPIAGETDLAEALGLALLTGPQTLVIKLDTDGQPYFVADGTGDYSIFIDDDGQPFFDDPPGGEDVYFDVDGAPVILTLT